MIWKLEEDLIKLLDVCVDLLSDDASFMLLTSHTPGVTAAVLRNLLLPPQGAKGGRLEAGDMVQASASSELYLPSGVYCRWIRD